MGYFKNTFGQLNNSSLVQPDFFENWGETFFGQCSSLLAFPVRPLVISKFANEKEFLILTSVFFVFCPLKVSIYYNIGMLWHQ